LLLLIGTDVNENKIAAAVIFVSARITGNPDFI
jgi:hypothetical protein